MFLITRFICAVDLVAAAFCLPPNHLILCYAGRISDRLCIIRECYFRSLSCCLSCYLVSKLLISESCLHHPVLRHTHVISSINGSCQFLRSVHFSAFHFRRFYIFLAGTCKQVLIQWWAQFAIGVLQNTLEGCVRCVFKICFRHTFKAVW